MKITETRTRSLIKSISFRAFEITVDTIFLSLVFGITIPHSILASIFIEFMCFAVHYITERLWNRIQWGRKVIK